MFNRISVIYIDTYFVSMRDLNILKMPLISHWCIDALECLNDHREWIGDHTHFAPFQYDYDYEIRRYEAIENEEMGSEKSRAYRFNKIRRFRVG